jgi:hypothetical protein
MAWTAVASSKVTSKVREYHIVALPTNGHLDRGFTRSPASGRQRAPLDPYAGVRRGSCR